MNPVPREIKYDYDQMAQDFKSAKKEAPIKPIKVIEEVYKKPVGKTYPNSEVKWLAGSRKNWWASSR